MLVFHLLSIDVDDRQFVLLEVTLICYVFGCFGHHLIYLSILLVLLQLVVLVPQRLLILKFYAGFERAPVPLCLHFSLRLLPTFLYLDIDIVHVSQSLEELFPLGLLGLVEAFCLL